LTETAADVRSMITDSPFYSLIYLGANIEIPAILSIRPDESLEMTGQRTTMRCVNADVSAVSVGTTLTVGYGGDAYIVREILVGNLTTQLILEAS